MLKLGKRRPSYGQYNRAYRYNKPKKSIPWLKIALSIPILAILLEFGAQGFLAFADREGKITGHSPEEKAYNLAYQTQNGQNIDGLGEQGQLAVQRSVGTGYQLVTNQESEFYKVNDRGFREKDSVSPNKNKNEIRIFVLGGSAAFGSGSSSNEVTIAQNLENLLQNRVQDQKKNPNKYRPDVFPFFQPSREPLFKLIPKLKTGQYNVINAGIPGYTSGNELAHLALNVIPYQPDVIVLVNGYGDLLLPSDQNQADIPKIDQFLANASEHFTTSLSQGVNEGVQKSALLKTAQSLISQAQAADLNQGIGSKQSLPQDEAELNKRIERYAQNQQKILQLAAKAGIPVIIVLQPEITSLPSDQLTPSEKAIQGKLNRKYREIMPKAYQKLVQTNQKLAKAYQGNTQFVNLYTPNFQGDQPFFIDGIHLTAQGNQRVAASVYASLSKWEKMQMIPENFHLK